MHYVMKINRPSVAAGTIKRAVPTASHALPVAQ
jgi:hypothetical protein